MLELKRVGIFTRDQEQSYPLESLTRLFNRARITLIEDARAAPGDLDLIIAMGGDGTVLRALTLAREIPVLAVNFGTVGFLTQSDKDDLDKVLVRLLTDDYFIEERLTLAVSYRGETLRCINEVVIKSTTRMFRVGVSINGHLVHQPRGDGIIVGTPTGSTGYLMSAGGPLATPGVDCIILKALNEYSFTSRPIIVPGDTEIELTIDMDRSRRGDIIVLTDGTPQRPARNGEVLTIKRSPIPARLVCFEGDYFFRNLKERLRW
ncbi:NAD(+)/NADH kinase [Myxococcota bacterium]|nr:NAD(+)/NADH kinase [Myxococcota bacterium]MBU1429202.1 NAD(+)/NADH kinase [Myxococcota bacterium]MBU1898514.1 NAD(+)/NADH kinase [Myxococcota bacterium]